MYSNASYRIEVKKPLIPQNIHVPVFAASEGTFVMFSCGKVRYLSQMNFMNTSKFFAICKSTNLIKIRMRFRLQIYHFISSNYGFQHVLIHYITWLDTSPYLSVNDFTSYFQSKVQNLPSNVNSNEEDTAPFASTTIVFISSSSL